MRAEKQFLVDEVAAQLASSQYLLLANFTGVTVKDATAIREQLRSYRNDGLFTPPSFRGSVEMPGHNGGANWGASRPTPNAARCSSSRRRCPR